MSDTMTMIAIVMLGVVAGAAILSKQQPETQWITPLDHTVRHKDRFCYVFNQQIHDRPVKVMVCRGLRDGE